jgi:hypothetical protein
MSSWHDFALCSDLRNLVPCRQPPSDVRPRMSAQEFMHARSRLPRATARSGRCLVYVPHDRGQSPQHEDTKPDNQLIPEIAHTPRDERQADVPLSEPQCPPHSPEFRDLVMTSPTDCPGSIGLRPFRLQSDPWARMRTRVVTCPLCPLRQPEATAQYSGRSAPGVCH